MGGARGSSACWLRDAAQAGEVEVEEREWGADDVVGSGWASWTSTYLCSACPARSIELIWP